MSDIPISNVAIWALLLIFGLPVLLCVAEYFLAKGEHEAGMFLLPIASLFAAFLNPWYGFVLGVLILSVGLLTRHLRRKKQSELDRMNLEDLGGSKKR